MSKTNAIPLVISEVVQNDLCIGCGVCIDVCPNNVLEITWNCYGFLTASANINTCDVDGACIEVCPFNAAPPESLGNEDKLAEIFLKSATKHHPKIGQYEGIYVGYSKGYRPTSSSGGVATYIYDRLFDKNFIDYVVTVGESTNSNAHYAYRIISSKDELISTSKTRYYPVTLAHAIKNIKSLNGKVAISGIGCFIKAVRLAQANDPLLKEKIVFLSGIICGGVKSRFFTEYLASKAGAEHNRFSKPEYRVKDLCSTASDYSFSCESPQESQIHFIKMREVGDMWGSGLFKANACDFCDDVTTELADVSFGDAWVEPYSRDGRGHNVIVSRSPLVTEILQQGKSSGDLQLEELSLERFLDSQQGSINHRHDGLRFRTELAKKRGLKVPPKRHCTVRLPLYLQLVQLARRAARAKSLEIWKKYREATNFDNEMKLVLFKLKLLTRISHVIKKLKLMIDTRK